MAVKETAFNMRNITLEELLEAGCHFGHQVTRGNPKARDYVFESRDGIQIIDLALTKEGLEEAGSFIKSIARDPAANILIVGTKRQAQEILRKEIERVSGEISSDPGLYWVTNKWIGGLLTNFSEISKNFKKLKDLQHKLNTPSEQVGYTKKEIGGWSKEKDKLEGLYGGVYTLSKVPNVLFIIDSHMESWAVEEATRMGIPTTAITDTNSDPALVDYPIPANDDAAGSLELIIGYILEAWREGRNSIKIQKVEDKNTEKKSPVKQNLSESAKNIGASVKIEGNKPIKKVEVKTPSSSKATEGQVKKTKK